jgi:hypothetical protein
MTASFTWSVSIVFQEVEKVGRTLGIGIGSVISPKSPSKSLMRTERSATLRSTFKITSSEVVSCTDILSWFLSAFSWEAP